MGAIKIKAMKTLAHELLRQNPGKFKKDFAKNKKILQEIYPFESKKVRNIIAGYISREQKRDGRPIKPPVEKEEKTDSRQAQD